MKKKNGVLSVCPIHDRKVQKVSKLRIQILEAIEKMWCLPNGPKYLRRTLQDKMKKVVMIIRPLSWNPANKDRLIYQVSMEIVELVHSVQDGLKKIRHAFTIDYVVPLVTISVPK